MVVLHKIKNKAKYFLIEALIKWSVVFRLPKLTCLVLIKSSKNLNPGKKYKVLVLRRSVFIEDVKAMADISGKINYFLINREYFRIIFYQFLNKNERKMINETNYHTANMALSGKRKYYEYLKKVIDILQKKLEFQACLSGNFTYIEQQEFSKICLENGIPFVVLHKEGMAVSAAGKDIINVYKNCKFIGSKYLAYNSEIIESLLGLGVDGLFSEKIEVVGVPRMDYYYSNREKTISGNNQIIFFSFYPRDKFIIFMKKVDQSVVEAIEKYCKNFHRWVIEFARDHPEFKVIIKTKLSKHYLDYVRDIFNDYSPEQFNNLTITNVGEPAKLIRDSRVVIGFKSTVLIEAVLAGKFIMSPDFSEFIKEDDNFFGDRGVVRMVNNKNNLYDLILNSSEHILNSKYSNDKFLENLIYKADGQSSVRAENSIINLIDK